MENLKGLTEKEAKKRLDNYGFNELKEILHISPLKILLRQIKNNFVVYLLFAAMFISFFVGKFVTAYTILAVIILVVTVGFFQEYKAEKAIAALKKMIISISLVIRDGKELEIPSREIVPGDIIVLRTGEKIPADCLILEAKELRVNEAVLTGESQEIKKIELRGKGDYKKENQIFMGTLVVNGRCIVKVLHTGMSTEFGKIAGMISTAEKELPLQKKVNSITKYMVSIAIIVSILTGIVMLTRNLPLSPEIIIEILIVVIALSVSAFPEGFPVVLISTLASGAYNMSQKNAIVNRMSIIETLGETTVICSDKTGTITKGEMTIKKILCGNQLFEVTGAGYESAGDFLSNGQKIDIQKNNSLKILLKAGVLCNDSKIERKETDGEYLIKGSPTEAALLIASAKAGIFRDDLNFIRKEEIPFSSERKIMSVLYREKNENYIYSKGALEILLKHCKFIQRDDGIFTLLERDRKNIMKINKELTSKSFRTLAIAYKKTKSINMDHFEEELVFIGLVGMEDPPREEIKEALKLCYVAGIKVKMITGDNKETAIAIAKQIGLNVELTEAIAYAHDIGHTPFGHAGESILNSILNGCIIIKDFNKGMDDEQKGFKHNWQGVRRLIDLETYSNKYYGLNLTDHTLWGILHHTNLEWKQCGKIIEENGRRNCGLLHEMKVCLNDRLKLDFYNRYAGLIGNSAFTIEAQVVSWADEISQRHHDLEDGLNSKIINEKECIDKII
ncbi:HAD-IC family P-type ATPase, partial [Candidatus Pacearchaeota archaeon]|nr:HAD-IC family P-type ATPase [Candidatus Pacearchaeota archaeon]